MLVAGGESSGASTVTSMVVCKAQTSLRRKLDGSGARNQGTAPAATNA